MHNLSKNFLQFYPTNNNDHMQKIHSKKLFSPFDFQTFDADQWGPSSTPMDEPVSPMDTLVRSAIPASPTASAGPVMLAWLVVSLT